MRSRRCGDVLVGEILDVDGRLGGFNFQWAWSTGRVAGQAIASGAKPSGSGEGRAHAGRVADHAPALAAARRCLDVASRRGRHALWLAEHGWRVTAIDRDAGALRELAEARRRACRS